MSDKVPVKSQLSPAFPRPRKQDLIDDDDDDIDGDDYEDKPLGGRGQGTKPSTAATRPEDKKKPPK
ncbi:hypothetical protein BDN72DRAFT_836503 [Pluteus cervinus]|uniref:Uncharacterized protein n=1 Tax=Pluteus cervinus TaxID=181527 RepID=A0ACD3B3D4_9AGAR|nr:hypothetical protein BDN72DRAFT_836503 [Pluteus cervinus]